MEEYTRTWTTTISNIEYISSNIQSTPSITYIGTLFISCDLVL